MLLTNSVRLPFSKFIHSLSRLCFGSGVCKSEQHRLEENRRQRSQLALKLDFGQYFFLIVLDFILCSVCKCFFWVHACVPHGCLVPSECQVPWNWRCGWLWTIMLSARSWTQVLWEKSTPSHWAICAASLVDAYSIVW